MILLSQAFGPQFTVFRPYTVSLLSMRLLAAAKARTASSVSPAPPVVHRQKECSLSFVPRPAVMALAKISPQAKPDWNCAIRPSCGREPPRLEHLLAKTLEDIPNIGAQPIHWLCMVHEHVSNFRPAPLFCRLYGSISYFHIVRGK